jgi:hypothetical protein
MILPGTYANGFAPRDGEPLFPELWRGCVGAWNPGLGPTGLTLSDWSPYKNHGTLTNMDPGTDWVASQGRYALDFDGINDFVPLGTTNLLGLTRSSLSATVSFWVYPRTTTRNAYIADWNSGGSVERIRIEMSGFNISAGRIGGNVLYEGGLAPVQTSSAPALNTWHHISITGSGSGMVLYWNGRLDSTESGGGAAQYRGGLSASANRVTLGRAGEANLLYANALLDDVVIHNYAITPEINRILASRRGIAYEMAPRSWSAQQIAAYRARYYSQVIGGGVI